MPLPLITPRPEAAATDLADIGSAVATATKRDYLRRSVTTKTRRMLSLLLTLAVVPLLSSCDRDNEAQAPEASTPKSDIDARSQQVLDSHVKADEPGCSAAVAIDGRVTWTGFRGMANMATHTKINADTMFDIASVSKQFTATAILLLANDGKLSLTDPISHQLPELPAWAATVTVADLMHQVSGIPDYVGLLHAAGYQLSDHTTQAQAVKALTAVPELEFTPGSRFDYSNSNYMLLGEIAQRVSGQPLPQFLQSRIFRPLDLVMSLDPAGNPRDRAVGYENGDPVSESPWEQIGDGGIMTAPSQLVRWADNYRTGKLGGPTLLKEQLDGAVPTESGGSDRYGAGIYLRANGMLDHDGSWAGFLTAFHISKDRRKSLAVSCNSAEQDPQPIADALGPLWA
jgi:CubicO group peptidase (beta-lactamase class C family)